MTLNDLKDYKLVWADEFDGNELDPKKWCFRHIMGRAYKAGTQELIYDNATDERVVKVEDGMLKLNVYYDEEKGIYYGPESTCTEATMSFVYGYLEMRARVPYTHGSWASFWMLGRNAINQDKSLPYFGEIDIFEINGTTHLAVSNLHKWYHDYKEGGSPYWEKGKPSNDNFQAALGTSTAPPDSRQGGIAPDDLEGFNTYGLLWTPGKIETYINGDLLAHFDIKNDFGRPSGMSCFHQPQVIVFNNYLMVDYANAPRMKTTHVTPEDVKTQIPYEIDYIRLYQREGEGELNLGEEKE